MDSKDHVMNAKEVAATLGINLKTVYAAAANGELPSRRIGRRVLFSRTAIMAWLHTQGRVTQKGA